MASPRPFRSPSAPLATALLLAALPVAALSQAAVAVATQGADALIGGQGSDTLQGLDGSDTIRGMEGPDLVNGNSGEDSLGGGPGEDQVYGGRGADNLNGGQGDDTVAGDRDNDTLAGGVGADLFLVTPDGGEDLVTDFDSAAGDRLVLPGAATVQIEDGPEGAVVRLSTGEAIGLRGVPAAAMGEWRAAVATEILRPPAAVPIPRAPASRWLQVVIIALGVLFVALLSKGLIQLVNYRARPPR